MQLSADHIRARIRRSQPLVDALRRLADHLDGASVRLLDTGAVLCAQGDPSDAVFFVLGGWIDVIKESASGHRVLTVIGPDEWLGELGALTDRARSATLVARRPSCVLSFPAEQLRRVVTPDWSVLQQSAHMGYQLGNLRPPLTHLPPTSLLVVGSIPHLAEALQQLREQDPKLGVFSEDHFSGCDSRAELVLGLTHAERRFERVLLLAGQDDAWNALALQCADRVLQLSECDGWRERLAGRPVERAVVGVAADAPDKAHLLRPGEADLVVLLEQLSRPPVSMATLRALPLLEALQDRELATLLRRMEAVHLPARDTLVHPGELAGGLLFVVSGELEVLRPSRSGERLVGRLRRGDVVGEGAVLLQRPSHVRVRASRDCVLVRLPADDAHALLRDVPSVALQLSRQLGMRADAYAEAPVADLPRPALQPERLTIALLPGPGVNAAVLGRMLEAGFSALETTLRIDAEDVRRSLGADALEIRPGMAGEGWVARSLERRQSSARIVLMVADREDTPWSQRCIRQADQIVIAHRADGDPTPSAAELCLCALRPDLLPQLLLQQPAGVQAASGTARWLAPRTVSDHHHLRAHSVADLGRICRRLSKRAIGLAFSGAGTRGSAHLGVVRGMRDLRIPIDTLVGNSSGGGIAALVAMGLSAEETRQRAYRVTSEARLRLGDMGPPLTSLMSGRAINRLLRAVFGSTRLEDLLLPVTVTALDIRSQKLVALTQGPVWEAIRATSSAPLFWPPVSTPQGLLVDGGLVNNMPADLLASSCRFGALIASNLSVDGETNLFADCPPYGHALSGWRLLLDRLLPWRTAQPVPALFDQVMHAMCMNSYQHRDRLAQLPRQMDFRLLQPHSSGFGFFGSSQQQTNQIEQQMHAVALERLQDLGPARQQVAK